jgi:hypothetical protein
MPAATESSNPKKEEDSMGAADLELLRNFVAAARSRSGFGIPFVKMNGNDGTWKAGKDGKDMKGRRLAADPHDTMIGFQKFENKRPVYILGRVADGYTPPPREELGDTDENHWHGGKDPWQPVTLVPLWDPGTREGFIFTTSSQGGRDAVTSLIDAYVGNCEIHPKDIDEVPLVELSSDSYVNTHGRKIHTPVFEIVSWIECPAALRRIKPPPVVTLAIEHKPEAEPEFGSDVSAKPKPRRNQATASSGGGIDDEIPFAPAIW